MFGIKKKLQKAMSFIACENPYNAVKTAAGSAAVIVAALPPVADTWALRMAEVLMVMSIFGHYGVKADEATVKALLLSGFAQAIGRAAAYAALEAADAAILANPALGYAIKVGIATSLISAVGISVIKMMEGSESAKVVTEIMCEISLGADLIQATDALAGIGAPTLDAQIAKAEEKTAYWQKAIDHYLESPDSEGGFVGEALLKNFWENRRTNLLRKKALGK